MGRKSPAVDNDRRRDARIYERLAAFARAHDFPGATEHAVHRWVSAELLPESAAEPSSFGQHITAPHADAERRLLALCRYRYTDKLGRYDLIGAQLWLDAFDVSTRFLRDAVGREFPRSAHRVEPPDEVAVSYQIARQRPIINAMPGLSFDERADIVGEVAGVLERGERPSDYGRELLARAMGLRPAETAGVLALLPHVTPEAGEQVRQATDVELLSVRRGAWAYFESHSTPDRHRSGRTRARIRLGRFISAFLLDRQFRR
jgi:hypothetical protein